MAAIPKTTHWIGDKGSDGRLVIVKTYGDSVRKKQVIDEGKQIKRALKQVLSKKQPGIKVVDWDWRFGHDHCSRRAIYIEVRYKLTSKPPKLSPLFYSNLAGKIHDAIINKNVKPWAYVDFREV